MICRAFILSSISNHLAPPFIETVILMLECFSQKVRKTGIYLGPIILEDCEATRVRVYI